MDPYPSAGTLAAEQAQSRLSVCVDRFYDRHFALNLGSVHDRPGEIHHIGQGPRHPVAV